MWYGRGFVWSWCSSRACLPTIDCSAKTGQELLTLRGLVWRLKKDRGNQQAFGDGVMDVGHVTPTPGTSEAWRSYYYYHSLLVAERTTIFGQRVASFYVLAPVVAVILLVLVWDLPPNGAVRYKSACTPCIFNHYLWISLELGKSFIRKSLQLYNRY